MSRITTEFGFHTTAAEVVAGLDLRGKRMVVTGGASGIGIETSRALAGTGAGVTLAVRDMAVGNRVATEIRDSTGNRQVDVAPLDLADRTSIGSFVSEWQGPLHVLVNNAGIMALQQQARTREGWEMQFAVNHLGHFALTLGLHRALSQAGDARVVAVSSSAHQLSPVVFDDLHYDFRSYDPLAAYGQSKSANILFAVELTRRWAAEGITANALMPGAISTNLQRHIGGMKTPVEKRKTPAEGAATTVLLAVSPQLAGVGGRYFVDCNEALPVTARTTDMSGVAPYALDPENARRLWDVSRELLEN